MQLIRRPQFKTFHLFLTLWLAFLLSLVSSSAFGGIVTLQWFSTGGTFDLYVMPLGSGEKPVLSLMSDKEGDMEVTAIMTSTEGVDEYTYTVTPKSLNGMAQIKVKNAKQVTVISLDSDDSEGVFSGVFAYSHAGGSEYRIVDDGDSIDCVEDELRNNEKLKLKLDVDKFLERHAQGLKNENDDSVPQSKIPPPDDVSPSSLDNALASSLEELNIKLENDYPILLEKVNSNVLQDVKQNYPDVFKIIAPPFSLWVGMSFESLDVDFQTLIGAFKKANKGRQSIPILGGGSGRSEEEGLAIDFIYNVRSGSHNDANAVSAETVFKASSADNMLSGLDGNSGSVNYFDKGGNCDEPFSDVVLSESLKKERDLISKIKSSEDCYEDVNGFVDQNLGSDTYVVLDRVSEPKDLPLYHIVQINNNFLSGSFFNQMTFFLKDSRYSQYPYQGNVSISSKGAQLPIPEFVFDFFEGEVLLVTVAGLKTEAKPLWQLLKQQGSQPFSFKVGWDILFLCLEGLEKLYKNSVFPASFQKETLFVTTSGSLDSIQNLFFTAPLHKLSVSKEPVEPSSELIKIHFEELMKLFVWFRTDQAFEVVAKDEIDLMSDKTPLDKWRGNPKEIWKRWLNDMGVFDIRSEELDVIEQLADNSPSVDTLNKLVSTMREVAVNHDEEIPASTSSAAQKPRHSSPKVIPVVSSEDNPHYLQCPKGHPLKWRQTREILTEYLAYCSGDHITCDFNKCKDKKEKQGIHYDGGHNRITDAYVMHCENCGVGSEGYDQCLASTVQQLGVLGFPSNLKCPKQHSMSFVSGFPSHDNPGEHNVVCDGDRCREKGKSIRSVHHYTCLDCAIAPPDGSGWRGHDLCMDCAIKSHIKNSSIYGGKHEHALQPVTLSPEDVCGTCFKTLGKSQSGYKCTDSFCAKYRNVIKCHKCAMEGIGFLGMGPPHPALKKM